jgi:hypothetical protein
MNEKELNELRNLGRERAKERFPKLNLKPEWVYWSGGIYRLTMYVDNKLAVGIGRNMNECCGNMIKDIERVTTRKHEHEIVEFGIANSSVQEYRLRNTNKLPGTDGNFIETILK